MLNWFNVWERLAVALPLVVVTCVTVALMCRAEEHARKTRARKARARRARHEREH